MVIDWGTMVVTAGSGLALFWLGTGVMTYIKHRRSIKAEVSGNERTARAEYIGDLEARLKARTEELEIERARRLRAERREDQLDDYCHDLRAWGMSAGVSNPPDWPPPEG